MVGCLSRTAEVMNAVRSNPTSESFAETLISCYEIVFESLLRPHLLCNKSRSSSRLVIDVELDIITHAPRDIGQFGSRGRMQSTWCSSRRKHPTRDASASNFDESSLESLRVVCSDSDLQTLWFERENILATSDEPIPR